MDNLNLLIVCTLGTITKKNLTVDNSNFTLGNKTLDNFTLGTLH